MPKKEDASSRSITLVEAVKVYFGSKLILVIAAIVIETRILDPNSKYIILTFLLVTWAWISYFVERIRGAFRFLIKIIVDVVWIILCIYTYVLLSKLPAFSELLFNLPKWLTAGKYSFLYLVIIALVIRALFMAYYGSGLPGSGLPGSGLPGSGPPEDWEQFKHQELKVDLGSKNRYVNYELFYKDKKQSQVTSKEPLKVSHWYSLKVWIDVEAKGKPIEGPRRPIREPQNVEVTTIYVVFEPSSAFKFNENRCVQTIQLPPNGKGNSTEATIDLSPKQISIDAKDLAKIGVRFYYNFTEIESIKIQAEIAYDDDDEPVSRFGLERPITAIYRTPKEWRNLEDIEKRALHISVGAIGQDQFRLIFLYEGVEFKGAVRLTKEEIESFILEARNELEYLAVNKKSPILLGKSFTLKDEVVKLASTGRSLWNKVFCSEENKSLWHIGEFLKEHSLKQGAIIQVYIEDDAHGFVFPWNLLYDKEIKEAASTTEILEGFWGMRYCIEQLSGEDRDCRSDEPIQLTQELQFRYMLFAELPASDKQKEYISKLPGRSRQRINVGDPIIVAKDCSELLKDCVSDILYFYTRGYTRRRLADLAFRSNQEGPPEPERSYIELSKGKLYLDDLEQCKKEINLRRAPIVLLNMCESAQITPSLSEGFIPFFLDQKASAVIGTECPMTTIYADQFATSFFEELFSGEKVGAALLKSRRKFLEENELLAPLGLAYTLYGLATVCYEPALLPKINSTADLT